MYIGVLDQNWIRDLFISIGYPIGPTSKLYEENQAKVKRVLEDRIITQARPLNVLITSLHELHLRKIFHMVGTRSNMKLSNLKSKPQGGKSLKNIIDHAIGDHFYPTPGSVHYKLLCLDHFRGPSQISFDKNKKIDIIMTKISNACNRTTKPRTTQI